MSVLRNVILVDYEPFYGTDGLHNLWPEKLQRFLNELQHDDHRFIKLRVERATQHGVNSLVFTVYYDAGRVMSTWMTIGITCYDKETS